MNSKQQAVNTPEMLLNTLPLELKRLIANTNWQADTLGESAAQTFLVQGKEAFYLKISAIEPWGGLQTEANALVWLGQYLPAPEVIYFERSNATDYLLIRALPGLPASDGYWRSDPKRLAHVLGESLQLLHALDPQTCPFDQRTDTKIEEVANYVRLGLIDTDDFDDENMGQHPSQILERLIAEKPVNDDWVVTHGDFCLPNILFDNWNLSGFIDLGTLGVGDRYQDLALCARSLADNLGTDQYNTHFFASYGLNTVNDEKLRYFRLLDELR